MQGMNTAASSGTPEKLVLPKAASPQPGLVTPLRELRALRVKFANRFKTYPKIGLREPFEAQIKRIQAALSSGDATGLMPNTDPNVLVD